MDRAESSRKSSKRPRTTPSAAPSTAGAQPSGKLLRWRSIGMTLPPKGFGFVEHTEAGLTTTVFINSSTRRKGDTAQLTPGVIIHYEPSRNAKGKTGIGWRVGPPGDAPAVAVASQAQRDEVTPCFRESATAAAADLDHAAGTDAHAKCKASLELWLTMKRASQNPESTIAAAASHHIAAMAKFVVATDDRLAASLASNCRKGDRAHAEKVVTQYKEASAQLIACDALTVAAVCASHRLMTKGLCTVAAAGALRTTNARAGSTLFPPHPLVPGLIAGFFETLARMIDRRDLTLTAVVVWAVHHFNSVHPFVDGNGRMSRLIASWIQRKVGLLPFIVPLCSSVEQRKEYVSGVAEAHSKPNQRPDNKRLTAHIQHCTLRSWTEFERLVKMEQQSTEEAAQTKAVQAARLSAREQSCMICLDDATNTTMLCCGGVFHFDCIFKWLGVGGQNQGCPQCRAPIANTIADEQRKAVAADRRARPAHAPAAADQPFEATTTDPWPRTDPPTPPTPGTRPDYYDTETYTTAALQEEDTDPMFDAFSTTTLVDAFSTTTLVDTFSTTTLVDAFSTASNTEVAPAADDDATSTTTIDDTGVEPAYLRPKCTMCHQNQFAADCINLRCGACCPGWEVDPSDITTTDSETTTTMIPRSCPKHAR